MFRIKSKLPSQVWSAALFGLAVLALSQAVWASPPQPLSAYVSDFADVLSPQDEELLTQHLRRLRQDPGVEVAVVTLRSIEDYVSDTTLESFAKSLFNQWGIGDANANDGALILLSTDDRATRIALGAGYPPVWDGRAHRVIEAIMLPEFSKANYAQGLQAGLQGLEDYVLRPFKAGQPVNGTEGMPEVAGGWIDTDLMLFLAFIAAILGHKLWSDRHRLGDKLAVRRPCPRCGARGVQVTCDRQQDAQNDGNTETLTTTRLCPNCNWQEARSEEVTALSHRSEESGGEGGFGGGSSSGGGASGRW